MTFYTGDLISMGAATSSKGNQAKWMTRDGKYFIKERFFYQGAHWRDDLVEIIASEYAKLCHLEVPVLEQWACTVDGRPAVYSENFCLTGTVFVSFLTMCMHGGHTPPLYMRCPIEYNFEYLKRVIASCTGLDMNQYLLTMAALDTIVGNEDRHYNNFGVLYDNTSGKYEYAPLFDFGLGLFEHDIRYAYRSLGECIPLMQCKPFALDVRDVVAYLNSRNISLLPTSVNVSAFTFPSDNARMYFTEVNKALGVEVVTCQS